ncbi:MAG TPA: helix-turn-helix domain-containing protein [candidate division Zixibacteria bacterium]|nr:helix-turn-helix domain-containing protein [candidate division Zixibacteria bacterium]
MITDEHLHFYQEIASILEQSHFTLSTPLLGCGGCFDLVAKKQHLLLLVKVLLSVDGLREDQAYELRKLAIMLEAFPLIVSRQIRNNAMIEDGVVYTRYDIPALSSETFRNLLINHNPPLIYASRGGFKVKFDGSVLRDKRIQKNYSMGDFAREIGVSKRAIYEYEHGTVDVSLETAMKIEDLLDEPLTLAINLFEEMKQIGSVTTPIAYSNEPRSDLEREVKEHFDVIGLTDQLWTRKIPIRVLAKAFLPEEKHRSTTITGIAEESKKEDIMKKIQVTYSISKLADADPLVIVSNEAQKTNVDGVRIYSIDELIRQKKKESKD